MSEWARGLVRMSSHSIYSLLLVRKLSTNVDGSALSFSFSFSSSFSVFFLHHRPFSAFRTHSTQHFVFHSMLLKIILIIFHNFLFSRIVWIFSFGCNHQCGIFNNRTSLLFRFSTFFHSFFVCVFTTAIYLSIFNHLRRKRPKVKQSKAKQSEARTLHKCC